MKFYLAFPRTFRDTIETSRSAESLDSMKAAKQQRKVSGVDICVLGYSVPPDPFCYGFVGLFIFWYAAEPAEGSERWLKAVVVHIVHVLVYTPWLLGAIPSPGCLSDVPILALGQAPHHAASGCPHSISLPQRDRLPLQTHLLGQQEWEHAWQPT